MDYIKNSLLKRGKQFLNIIKPKTRLGLLSGIFLVALFAVCLFVVGNNAFAQSEQSVADFIMQKIGDAFLWIASKFMAATVFILRFVIEIASYNGYINSTAVGLGWILVRDVANMFFVVILMLIAFGTVLGLEQYEWKKLLVKFVLAAILVNFSRVICGVIIDAAQVFMMTFISGVAATAGGNLINALNLNDVVTFSSNPDPSQMVTGNMVASAMFACIFAFGAMVVIGAYLVVLLARVVALWILIILSPLSFVLGIIPKFQTYSGMWWTEFANNVIVGPVVAFFLWLAFAVAGGGTAHNEFNEDNAPYAMGTSYKQEMQAISGPTDEGGSNLNAFMEDEKLASFLIAFFMLMAGVKVAKKLGAAGSEILGQAGSLAMKGAMVMSGAAAAKWGGRQAVAGAKKVGKFAAMKVPIVGGEAWMRTGRRIKARAQLAIGGVQKAREAGMAELYKKAKGIGGPLGGLARAGVGVVGIAGLTGRQKEKRVKFLESAVESLNKERDESLGMGGLREGMLAGERLKAYELAKQKADEDKEIGLTHPLEQLLRKEGRNAEADAVVSKRAQLEVDRAIKQAGSIEQLRADIADGRRQFSFKHQGQELGFDDTMRIAQAQSVREEDLGLQKRTAEGEAKARALEQIGRHDMAELVRNSVAALENKKMNEAYSNLDGNEMLAMFDNKLRRRDNARERLNQARATGDMNLVNQARDDLALAMRDIHNFKTNTMGNEHVRQSINRRGAESARYSGTDSLVDRKKLELSVLTGLDANNASNQGEIDELLRRMNRMPGMQEEYKRRSEAAERVFVNTGDSSEAVIMDKGIVTDPNTGQRRVVRGLHNNIGDYRLDGAPQLAGDNAFEVDREKVDYYKREPANYKGIVNVDFLFSGRDATGNVVVDADKLDGVAEDMSSKTPALLRSLLKKALLDRLNEAARNNEMTQATAHQIIERITRNMNNAQKDVIRQIMNEVQNLSGI